MLLCNESNENEYNELEIDEVCILFKQWSPTSYSKVISDILILDLIQHFYPDVIIENNKFILNVKSTVWDKRKEVIDSFRLFKKESQAILNGELNDTISTKTSMSYDTDPYQHYCAQKKNKYNLLVSKEFYEKIVLDLELELNYEAAAAEAAAEA